MTASTLADLAKLAGVSTATASRALRGLPGVSEPVRERIVALAKEHDFALHGPAASLASGRTGTLAVVAPYISRWFFVTVIAAAQDVWQSQGMSTLLYNVGTPEARRDFFATLPVRNRADALLVVALPLTEADRQRLDHLDMPVAFVGDEVPGYSSVGIDDFAAGSLATQHLVDLGHRRIAFAGGDDGDRMHFTSAPRRRAGYEHVLERAGIAKDSQLMVPADFTPAGGREAARRLLALQEPPTAVFAASDEIAMGVLQVARELRVQVPAALSVIGIDDHEAALLLDLTTVGQRVAEQGARAAQMLLNAIPSVTPHTQGAPERALVHAELVERSTTGPPG